MGNAKNNSKEKVQGIPVKDLMALIAENDSKSSQEKFTYYIVNGITAVYVNLKNPNIWKKDGSDEMEKKYSLKIMWEKSNTNMTKTLKKAYDDIYNKFKMVGHPYKSTVTDGDKYCEKREMIGKKVYEVFKGKYYIPLTSQFPIPIIDKYREKQVYALTDKSEQYGETINVPPNFDSLVHGQIINLKFKLKPYSKVDDEGAKFGIKILPVAIQLTGQQSPFVERTTSQLFDGFEFEEKPVNTEDTNGLGNVTAPPVNQDNVDLSMNEDDMPF